MRRVSGPAGETANQSDITVHINTRKIPNGTYQVWATTFVDGYAILSPEVTMVVDNPAVDVVSPTLKQWVVTRYPDTDEMCRIEVPEGVEVRINGVMAP